MIYSILAIASAAVLAERPGLKAFLAGLPSLDLSDTGRRNVAARFGLSEPELVTSLNSYEHSTHSPAAKGIAL